MFKLIIAGLGWWGKVMIQRLSSSKKVKIVNLIEPYPDKEALQLAKNFNFDISNDFEQAVKSIDFDDFSFSLEEIKNLNKITNQFIKYNLPLIFIITIFLQIIIGAFVPGMDAGKIYNTWPLMGNNYFPDDNNFFNLFNYI